MLTAFFTDGPVTDFAGAAASDTDRYAAFHRHMLDRGIYLAPSPVRGDDAVARAHAGDGRGDRGGRAGVRRMSVLAEIGRPRVRREPAVVGDGAARASRRSRSTRARCPDRYLLGVEMIREAYLLHHGRARVFSQDDAELALLTGDYLYAAGLVEICSTGDLSAVADLADLISRCARNRGDETGDDEVVWADCVGRLGRQDVTASSGRRPA